MFNIIETLRNYFTCELLHDNLSSDVALQPKLLVAIFNGKVFGGSILPPIVACVVTYEVLPVFPHWIKQ